MFYHLEFHQMNFAIFIASIMNIVKAIIITITLRMNFFQPGRESHLLANETSDSPPTTSIRPTNAYAPIIIESIRVIPGKISKYASTPHITEVVMPTKSFFFPEARDNGVFSETSAIFALGASYGLLDMITLLVESHSDLDRM